jgi:hypothetical protein
MKYHTQLFRHDPDNGVYGDCHRTALACVFDKDSPLDVPHFLEDNPTTAVFYQRVDVWLLEQGFRGFHFPIECADLDAVLEYMLRFAPGIHYILGGKSPRGTHHSVVACGGSLAHDPHPDGSFIVGPCDDGYFWIELFIPVRFWRPE